MVQLQHMPQQVQNKPAKFHKPQHANAECSEGMWVLVGSFFMFSDFYQLDLQNKTCVALADLQWSIRKNHTSDLVMVTKNARLLVP